MQDTSKKKLTHSTASVFVIKDFFSLYCSFQFELSRIKSHCFPTYVTIRIVQRPGSFQFELSTTKKPLVSHIRNESGQVHKEDQKVQCHRHQTVFRLNYQFHCQSLMRISSVQRLAIHLNDFPTHVTISLTNRIIQTGSSNQLLHV